MSGVRSIAPDGSACTSRSYIFTQYQHPDTNKQGEGLTDTGGGDDRLEYVNASSPTAIPSSPITIPSRTASFPGTTSSPTGGTPSDTVPCIDSREERNESDPVSESVSEADCEMEPSRIDGEEVERGDESVVVVAGLEPGESKSGMEPLASSCAFRVTLCIAFRSLARVWWSAGLSVLERTRWVRVPICEAAG
jgi:hypothetical protein